MRHYLERMLYSSVELIVRQEHADGLERIALRLVIWTEVDLDRQLHVRFERRLIYLED